MNRTIEHLSPARIEELWPEIEPLLTRVSGDYAPNSVSPEYIRESAMFGVTHLLGMFADGKLSLVAAVEFTVANKVRTASILALAGADLMRFRSEFYKDVLAWFKAAGAKAVDAYAEQRMADIYKRKFGFTQSCSYVRMAL